MFLLYEDVRSLFVASTSCSEGEAALLRGVTESCWRAAPDAADMCLQPRSAERRSNDMRPCAAFRMVRNLQ
jgi:hypothetical protein